MKVLIYLEEEKLAPKGGPYAVGYYYRERRKNLLFFFLRRAKKNQSYSLLRRRVPRAEFEPFFRSPEFATSTIHCTADVL